MQVLNGFADLELTLTYYVLSHLESTLKDTEMELEEVQSNDTFIYEECNDDFKECNDDFKYHFGCEDFGSYIDVDGVKTPVRGIDDLMRDIYEEDNGKISPEIKTNLLNLLYTLQKDYLSSQIDALQSSIYWVKECIENEDDTIFYQVFWRSRDNFKWFPLLPENFLDLDSKRYEEFLKWDNLISHWNSLLEVISEDKANSLIDEVTDLTQEFIDVERKDFSHWPACDLIWDVDQIKKLIESINLNDLSN